MDSSLTDTSTKRLGRLDLGKRGEELAELSAALGAALAGDGRLVLVAGPAGIGKTSLLEAFADGAVAHEMTTQSGGLGAVPVRSPWAMSASVMMPIVFCASLVP